VLEQEFEEGFGKLVGLIREGGERALGLKEFSQRAQLIDFLKRFKQIYKKEFFADNLTCILLRDFYFDTEDVEEEKEAPSSDFEQKPFNVA
jgi:hypothetical protein